MSEPRKFKWVGTRPIRPDGVDKVTGRANYGADRFPTGGLHGVVVRSPHAHARIVRIDASKALAAEGVKAVITGADLPTLPPEEGGGGESPIDFHDLSCNTLARDKVLYHGHPVAAVAATTRDQAERAATLVEVDYETLPVVLDVEAAMAPDAPLLHEGMLTRGVEPKPERPSNVASRIALDRGDIEAGFAEADLVVEREFRTETVHQGYIESHAAVAEASEDGNVTIWTCTQGPFTVRNFTARLLDMPLGKFKVIPSEIGGGFGGKTTTYVEPLAAALALRAGRPVKIVMTRDEVFRATGPAGGTRIRVKIGARRDGTLTAADATLVYEAGAYKGSAVQAGCMCMIAPYKIDHFRIEGFDVVVNKPKTTAYRAPGAPMAAFAVESVIDEIARELEIDPLALRLHNAVQKGDQAVYGPRFREIGCIETLEAAKRHPHYDAPLGPNQGRGVASGFWFNAGMNSSAAVSLNEDGTVTVVAGTPDIGGSRASLALMCAEEVGIDVQRIKPIVADTETIGYNDGTGGSRVTFATGMAVIEASRDVVRQLCERAAAIWEVEPDQVEWRDGAAHPRNGATDASREPLDIGQLARRAGRTGGPISARSALTARGVGPSFATHIVDVEVDADTGHVKIVRYTALQDAGKAVHPSYVEGQYQGGAAQGIGWALNEEFVYDERGVMQNAGFLDYRMPVALDLPMIDTVIVEVPNPRHPHGVRGVGEAPIVPPIGAIANAIADATGVRLRHTPMSPPKLLDALDAKAASGA